MKRYDILRKNYEKSCKEIVEAFCKKQGFDFEYWVGDTVGGVASCGSYYFYLDDIILDLSKKVPTGGIIEWNDSNLDSKQKYINYKSYIMGMRHNN